MKLKNKRKEKTNEGIKVDVSLSLVAEWDLYRVLLACIALGSEKEDFFGTNITRW